MAKKKTDSTLVKTAARVGRTLGRAARGMDAVAGAAKKLVGGAGRKKVAKKAKAVKKAVKRAAKPASSGKTRAEATAAARNARQGTLVDERAAVRSKAPTRWSARKPR